MATVNNACVMLAVEIPNGSYSSIVLLDSLEKLGMNPD